MKQDVPVETAEIQTWDELVNRFLEHCESKNLSKQTTEWYRYRLKAVAKLVGHTPAEATTKMLRQALSTMLASSNKPTTARNTRTATFTFFKFLEEEEYISSNPMIKVEAVRCPKTLIQPFTPEQVQDLLGVINQRKFCGQRDYTAILLLLDTGLRISECINIKLEDICWSNQTVKVMGKGSKERVVPFGSVSRKALTSYISRRGSLHHTYLFVSDLGEHISPKQLQEVISVYGDKANIVGVRCSPHTFRHTFATEAIRAGMDVLHLQRILGHSSLDMLRVYVNLVTDDIQNAHKMYAPVDRIFGKDKAFREPRTRIR